MRTHGFMIRDPSEDDVRRACAAVELGWFEEMRYWCDDHAGYLSAVAVIDLDTAPDDLREWFAKKQIET